MCCVPGWRVLHPEKYEDFDKLPGLLAGCERWRGERKPTFSGTTLKPELAVGRTKRTNLKIVLQGRAAISLIRMKASCAKPFQQPD